MVIRVFFFLLGFGLTVIGFTYMISYLNLLTMGYSFMEYLSYIISKRECLISILGFSIVTITIFKGGNKSDICI